nr:AAA family ATPase [Desulfobacterales bacterium]
ADPKGDPEPDVKVKEIIKDKFPELNLSGDMSWDDVFDILSGAGMADPDLEVLNDLWHEREIPDVVPQDVGGDYIKPDCYDTVVNYLSRGANVLAYGPAGSGKSRLFKEVAKSMGKEWFMISGTGGKRYSAVFGGDKLKIGKGDKQVTEWVESPLLEAVQKPCLIQIEEIFSFDPDTVIGFNGLLERDMRMIETPKGIIEVHPECVFCATANINGRSRDGNKFTGTKKQDDSLNDRFNAFKIDYSPEVEKAILDRCAKAAHKGVIREKLEKLREQIAAANISFDASTRRLIEVVDAVNAGVKVDDAFEISFLNHLSQAERTKIGM